MAFSLLIDCLWRHLGAVAAGPQIPGSKVPAAAAHALSRDELHEHPDLPVDFSEGMDPWRRSALPEEGLVDRPFHGVRLFQHQLSPGAEYCQF